MSFELINAHLDVADKALGIQHSLSKGRYDFSFKPFVERHVREAERLSVEMMTPPKPPPTLREPAPWHDGFSA